MIVTATGDPSNRVLFVAADAASSTLTTLSADPDCEHEGTREDGALL